MGPDGSRGFSTTSLVASRFSRGQQFGSCSQSKKVKGIVNESLSGPGGDSATPPVAPFISWTSLASKLRGLFPLSLGSSRSCWKLSPLLVYLFTYSAGKIKSDHSQ